VRDIVEVASKGHSSTYDSRNRQNANDKAKRGYKHIASIYNNW